MSDDVKSTAKPRKSRPRILVVNNPNPDSSSSSDEEHILNPYYQQSVLGSIANPSFPEQSYNPSPYPPPLTTTNLPEVSRPYPSSRSNPSNPALSSPSSTSSRAFESTPPPSTPGQSSHPDDLSSEGTLRQDTAAVSYSEVNDTTPPSATSRAGASLTRHRAPYPRPGHGRRASNNTRPTTVSVTADLLYQTF